jgi:hypothetical protein
MAPKSPQVDSPSYFETPVSFSRMRMIAPDENRNTKQGRQQQSLGGNTRRPTSKNYDGLRIGS